MTKRGCLTRNPTYNYCQTWWRIRKAFTTLKVWALAARAAIRRMERGRNPREDSPNLLRSPRAVRSRGYKKRTESVCIRVQQRAYAARLFTGLVSYSGVPSFGTSEDYGMSAFFGQRRKQIDSLTKDGKYFNVQIECLGLWDTVNSTTEDDLGERTLPSNVLHIPRHGY